jgi:hypothetical protein
MATLNIGGKKVKVGDEFLQMTPEQQSAAVEEIAAQLSVTEPEQSEQYTDALSDASERSSMFSGPVEPRAPDVSLADRGQSFAQGVIEGIPILGKPLSEARVELDALLAQIPGGMTPEDVRAKAAERRTFLEENAGNERLAGNVTGAVASMIPLGSTAIGARALGIAGPNLAARAGMSAVSSGAISAADAAVRGGDAEKVVNDGVVGLGVGGAIPVVGAGLSAAAKAIGNKVAPMVGAVTRPAVEAERQLGMAATRDAGIPGNVATAADETAARNAGVPLMNVDRGGETVRALARSVANKSPEARQIITKAADERFATQGMRAVDVVKRVAGGNVDDLSMQEAIKNQARLTNQPRYARAYQAPEAAAVWTPTIRQLMQSNLFRVAVKGAESRGTDVAAVTGVKAVRNPFVFNRDGSIGLADLPTGGKALPSLQFWDVVQRNLSGMIDQAKRGAKPDHTRVADLTAMKAMLTSELDAAVPAYKVARQGAATFFDAEDALEAGRKFAIQPKTIPEAKKAFADFSDYEKRAFRTGYASELVDRIKASRDRVNVIEQVFGSPAAREMNEMVFGRMRARELEAYVRVEQLADRIRGALGNSTTARQLLELGIGTGVGAGAGFTLSGGNLNSAMTGAALGAGAKGIQYLGQRADGKVMERLAELLVSKDASALQHAIANAAVDPKWLVAIKEMEQRLGIPVRGALLAGGNQ